MVQTDGQHGEEQRAKIVGHLDRHVAERGPEDIKQMLMACERWRRHLQVLLKNLKKKVSEGARGG